MNSADTRTVTTHCGPISAVQFGFWFLAFMLLESFVNSAIAAQLGAPAVNAAYCIGLFCTATGLLSFGLVHRQHASWCTKAFPIVVAVCLATSLGVMLARQIILLAALSCTALLTCGFVGGWAHTKIAHAYGETSRCGRVIGASTGLAVCVQFVVQNFTQGAAPQIACILVSLVALTALDVLAEHTSSPQTMATPTPVRAWPQDPHDKRRHGIYLVIAAAVLTVIFTLNDAVVVDLDASGSLELFSGVRLFYALGLVVAGCLFDLGPRFSFTFTTVAVQLLAVLIPYFLGAPEWYTLNMSLFYFYGGFYVVFVTAEFVAFSSQTSNSALWAGLGRTTRSYVTAASVIPVAALYTAFGVVALVALGVALNMILIMVCVADVLLLARYRLPGLQSSMTEGASRDFDSNDIERFAQDMGLTPREHEILVLLVTTEDENQKIANDLDISRRTLQRHIARIYEKAAVESRIGLYRAVSAYAAAR